MRKPFKLLIVLFCVSILAACGRDGGDFRGAKIAAPAEAEAPVALDSLRSEAQASGETAQTAPSSSPNQAPSMANAPAGSIMLAYSYAMSIQAPIKALPALAKAHEQACLNAGPQVCQVLGLSTQSYGEDSIGARLSLRAEPKWLAKFRAKIDADAKNAKGRVRESSVDSEDLSRAIVDTNAQLNAQKTLRTRLQVLLASRPGKLSELLEIERELARVQGQIDSQESQLAVMHARVAMSTLELNYQSETLTVASGVFEPLAQAFKEFAGNVVAGLAAMVTIASMLLPWLIVLIPAGYYGVRFWKRRRTKKAPHQSRTQ